MSKAATVCASATALTVLLVVLWLPHFSFESSPWDVLILLAAISFGVAVVAAFAMILLAIRALVRQMARREGA